MSGFSSFSLSPIHVRKLEAQGIVTPTPIQEAAIPALLEGRDLIGQARTGSGKTLAYALPLLAACKAQSRGVQALVLVPTRELAVQVGGIIGDLADRSGVRVALLYGGRAMGPQEQALVRGDQVVVATPGRLLDHLGRGSLSLRGVRYLVLDEADEMLGAGFAPAVERILDQAPRDRQMVMFSATVPEWVRQTAKRHLHDPLTVMVDPDPENHPPIQQIVYEVKEGGKPQALRTLLNKASEGPTIVFGRTKHHVKRLALQLSQEGYQAAALQGNMSQSARERVMADFRAGRVSLLLATNVAARGLDVEGVSQIINYELPESAEWFTHRSGRTGRMGRSGLAVTLLEPADLAPWRQIERTLGQRFPRHSWETGLPLAEAVTIPQGRQPAAASTARVQPRRWGRSPSEMAHRR